jgi:hypothetical protein
MNELSLRFFLDSSVGVQEHKKEMSIAHTSGQKDYAVDFPYVKKFPKRCTRIYMICVESLR